MICSVFDMALILGFTLYARFGYEDSVVVSCFVRLRAVSYFSLQIYESQASEGVWSQSLIVT